MKQIDLAVAMGDGMSQSMISMIETGRLLPSFGRATQAARALGVSLDWIAGLTDDHRPAAEISSLLAECRGQRIPIIGEAAAGYPTRWRASKPKEDRETD